MKQDWQTECNEAKRKLEEAEEHLRNALLDARESPEPPSDEFCNKMRRASIEIIELIGKF